MTDRPTPKMTVYGAPWCPDCKRAKQFLGEQRVPYDWVDIDLDEEGRAYVQRVNDGKQIIPTIVFEDGSILVEPTNSELALKLDIGLSASRTFYDLIVVGGGPAGLTAALYAAREGIDTLIVEQSAVGGQAGVTERIENYPGFPDGIQGARLADQMRLQAERFGVEILQAQSVTGVRATDNFKVISTEGGRRILGRRARRRHRQPVQAPRRAGRGRPHRRGHSLLRDVRRPRLTNEVQHLVRVLPWEIDIVTSPLKSGVRLPDYRPRAVRSGRSLQVWIARHRRSLGS